MIDRLIGKFLCRQHEQSGQIHQFHHALHHTTSQHFLPMTLSLFVVEVSLIFPDGKKPIIVFCIQPLLKYLDIKLPFLIGLKRRKKTISAEGSDHFNWTALVDAMQHLTPQPYKWIKKM